jgi:hypothetical protein
METKVYEVTDKAGLFVAGQRKPASGLIRLTDRQAGYELKLGTIRPTDAEAPASSPPAPRSSRRGARRPKL